MDIAQGICDVESHLDKMLGTHVIESRTVATMTVRACGALGIVPPDIRVFTYRMEHSPQGQYRANPSPVIHLFGVGCTRVTVCHEIAHHIANTRRNGDAEHGLDFADAYCEVLETMFPERADEFWLLFHRNGVPVTRPDVRGLMLKWAARQ